MHIIYHWNGIIPLRSTFKAQMSDMISILLPITISLWNTQGIRKRNKNKKLLVCKFCCMFRIFVVLQRSNFVWPKKVCSWKVSIYHNLVFVPSTKNQIYFTFVYDGRFYYRHRYSRCYMRWKCWSILLKLKITVKYSANFVTKHFNIQWSSACEF